jgi:hypothetical protein
VLTRAFSVVRRSLPFHVACDTEEADPAKGSWRDERNTRVCGAPRLPKVTGESGIGGLVGRLDEFLSVPQRLGTLRGPVKKLALLPRSSPARQASKNVTATNSFFCYEGRRSGASQYGADSS